MKKLNKRFKYYLADVFIAFVQIESCIFKRLSLVSIFKIFVHLNLYFQNF